MTDDGDRSGRVRSIVADRETAACHPESLDLQVVPDDANDTVTFIAADADAYETRTAWLTADASLVVDVTEKQ